ncbi:hypothetical protein [Paenibacillus roseus]
MRVAAYSGLLKIRFLYLEKSLKLPGSASGNRSDRLEVLGQYGSLFNL